MSADATLDQAFTTLLAKAQKRLLDSPQATVKPATINFEWTGGGQPITVAVDPITLLSTPAVDPVLVEVPFPSTIIWAHMFAGDAAGRPVAVSASVDVELTQLLTFNASTSISAGGFSPALSSQAVSDLSIVGWQTNLATGDLLIARLTSFVGLATWVALTLQILPTNVPIGVAGVTDGTGDQIVDSNGNIVVLRN